MPHRRNEPSETLEDILILKEITEKKRSGREPGRWQYVLSVLRDKGYQPVEDPEGKCIRFSFRGNTVTVWPYKGWFSGKGVKDGRGIDKLLKQI